MSAPLRRKNASLAFPGSSATLDAPLRRKNASLDTTMLQFPGSSATRDASTVATGAEDIGPSLDAFGGKLREAFEAVLTEQYIQRALRLPTPDDPFDAVYISRLNADPVNASDVSRLQEYAHVKDISDTININDGWDD